MSKLSQLSRTSQAVLNQEQKPNRIGCFGSIWKYHIYSIAQKIGNTLKKAKLLLAGVLMHIGKLYIIRKRIFEDSNDIFLLMQKSLLNSLT